MNDILKTSLITLAIVAFCVLCAAIIIVLAGCTPTDTNLEKRVAELEKRSWITINYKPQTISWNGLEREVEPIQGE